MQTLPQTKNASKSQYRVPLTILTYLTAEENNCSQTTPAMQTVQVWNVVVIVEIKHCL